MGDFRCSVWCDAEETFAVEGAMDGLGTIVPSSAGLMGAEVCPADNERVVATLLGDTHRADKSGRTARGLSADIDDRRVRILISPKTADNGCLGSDGAFGTMFMNGTSI